MVKNKKRAIESLSPFIKYMCNLNTLRKIGFSFFIKSCSMNPECLKSSLSNDNGIYSVLFSKNKKVPSILIQVMVFMLSFLFIASIAFQIPYIHYFFSSVVISSFFAFLILIKMSSISKAGLSLQFRIPDNFQNISDLVSLNYRGMITSKSKNVRYSAIAYDDMKSGELDVFKLTALLNGLIEYFEISDFDMKVILSHESVIEKMLNKDYKGSV